MSIKTSLNIKSSQAIVLYELASQFNVPLSFILNSLAKKILKSNPFSVKFLQAVAYQDRLSDVNDSWKHVPVSFEGDVYEKCLDLRKLFKVSVSLALAFAISKYIDELIEEFEGKKGSDNYFANYLLFYTGVGHYCHITLLWDMVTEEKLQKIKELHTEP